MFTKKNSFTDAQINEMIELHKNGMLHKYIAEKFNTSRSSVDRILQNTDLPSRHPRLTKERKEKAYNLYLRYKDVDRVAKEIHMSDKTIYEILKEKGITFDMSEIKQIYDINQEYFDIINTQEKAYYLGFLAADGSVGTKNNNIQITLQAKDKYMVEQLRDAIGSNHKIWKLDYHSKKETYQDQYQLSIMNKHMHDSLIKQGVVPRKTYYLEFPKNLSEEYYSSYIRGYFDGNGTIKKKEKRISFVSTKSFCESVKEILKNTLGINSYILMEKRSKTGVTATLCVAGGRQVKIFLDWLYSDTDLYLKRKYELYQKMYCN